MLYDFMKVIFLNFSVLSLKCAKFGDYYIKVFMEAVCPFLVVC